MRLLSTLIPLQNTKKESLIKRLYFQGDTKRSVKNMIGKKLFNKIEKGVDKAMGESVRRELMEQRDRVVIDINPDEKGFKPVLSGQCFRSEKIQQKISSGKLLYLTIMTRQFLIQVRFLK